LRLHEHPEERLVHYVQAHNSKTPELAALCCDGLTLTYGQLPEAAAAYTATLTEAGVEPGQVVAVYGNSRPECLLLFLACCEVGAVFLGLGPKSTGRELATILDDANPVLVYAVEGSRDIQLDKLRAVVEANGFEPSAHNPPAVFQSPDLTFATFARKGAAAAVPHAHADAGGLDVPCAMVYTSGTTGTPKGALLSQRGMLRSAALTYNHWYGGVEPMRIVAQVPINHVGWLVCKCVTALLVGGTLFFHERFDAAATMRLIQHEQLTVWTVFPAMLMLAMETPEFAECDLASLERVALGTTPSPDVLSRFRTRSDAAFSASYGLTEACGGSLTVTDEGADLGRQPDAIGRALPGVEVRVVDESGDDVACGIQGELLIRDASVFLGYLNRPAATTETLDSEGWLHTGDAAALEADGSLRFVGRVKEMFKSGGYNVYPTEVEGVIGSHPSVSTAVVVSVPDPLWEEVGVAFVVLARDGTADVEELARYAKAELANYKVPKHFMIVDELPLLRNEKFDKKLLQERARQIFVDTEDAETPEPAKSETPEPVE